MAPVPDTILMAFVDGELTANERAWVESELARDPALRQRLEPFAITRAALPVIFDAPVREPIPDRLLETIRTAGRAEKPAASRHAPSAAASKSLFERLFGEGFGWQPALGFAASLLIAYGAGLATHGTIVGSPSDGALTRVDRGTIVATGRLEQALNTSTSSAEKTFTEDAIQPLITLRCAEGRICRYYGLVSRNSKSAGGLACRKAPGLWELVVQSDGSDTAVSWDVSQDNESEPIDPVIRKAITGLGNYQVLSDTEEAFLIKNGWPSPKASVPGQPPVN